MLTELCGLALGLLPWIAGLLSMRWMLTAPRFQRWNDATRAPRTDAALLSAVAMGIWAMIIAESLSLFRLFDVAGVTLAWIATVGGLAAVTWRSGALRLPPLGAQWKLLNGMERLLCALAAFLAVGTLAQCLWSPPNAADSLSYHLPRQIYWIQQGSIHHFFTTDLRQVIMPPWTEICGAQLLLLSGGDHLHNLMGWSLFGLTGLAAARLAGELGAHRTGRLLAAFLVVATPMAILEASNAKNDLPAALWVCMFAGWVVRLSRATELRPVDAFALGGSAGLALATKGTALVFLLPWGVYLLVLFIRRWRGFASGLPAGIAIFLGLVALVNGPHLARNIAAYGGPMGPESDWYDLGNAHHDAASIFSNTLRNTAPHLALPWDAWNREVFSAIEAAHDVAGVALNDPGRNYLSAKFSEVVLNLSDDCLAAAPAHLWLFGIAVLLLVRRTPERRWPVLAVAAVAVSFVVFCGWLRWQPWHQRLLLPLLVLMAPISAAALSNLRHRWPMALAAIVTFSAALPAFTCHFRPLFGPRSIFVCGRFESLSIHHPGTGQFFSRLCDLAASLHPRTVGFLDVEENSYEYTVMVGLQERLSESPPVFLHANPLALAGSQKSGPVLPDVVIARTSALNGILAATPGAQPNFTVAGKFDGYYVLTPVRAAR